MWPQGCPSGVTDDGRRGLTELTTVTERLLHRRHAFLRAAARFRTVSGGTLLAKRTPRRTSNAGGGKSLLRNPGDAGPALARVLPLPRRRGRRHRTRAAAAGGSTDERAGRLLVQR